MRRPFLFNMYTVNLNYTVCEVIPSEQAAIISDKNSGEVTLVIISANVTKTPKDICLDKF